ncbi:ApbE family lipoprotein [Shewanella sediminis HAW-EB3]|uniref:FAD:protein FMN transferase n=1 Tax=Shewanella sediminis (strain HAW-EB3) TaxID=425104 RepID=A8FZZ7_SHESH|nr:FAD:protein FMN transferase [Shewanella sediminis]ABV38420.1 ApbE family lipoprotein [Shewanella sediminis HAW-EB3]
MNIQENRESPDFELSHRSWGHLGSFRAMASPCELLIATEDEHLAREMMSIAAFEAMRIEQKFSRFIEGNPLWKINHAAGTLSLIDAEIASLLQFARQCHQLSDGRFDISAGPLMKLWRFDGGELPEAADIEQARALVDFSRVDFNERHLQFPSGMSLDFGGIAKEYAVDRVAYLLAEKWPTISVLVNFGGDIACPVSKGADNEPWQVGIENPQRLDSAGARLEIRKGALATSGDTRRFIEKDGQRFGHIIDPGTGYPVVKAPRSVTVLGPNCVTAGMLATMAMLEGEKAETFLSEQEVEFKCFR